MSEQWFQNNTSKARGIVLTYRAVNAGEACFTTAHEAIVQVSAGSTIDAWAGAAFINLWRRITDAFGLGFALPTVSLVTHTCRN